MTFHRYGRRWRFHRRRFFVHRPRLDLLLSISTALSFLPFFPFFRFPLFSLPSFPTLSGNPVPSQPVCLQASCNTGFTHHSSLQNKDKRHWPHPPSLKSRKQIFHHSTATHHLVAETCCESSSIRSTDYCNPRVNDGRYMRNGCRLLRTERFMQRSRKRAIKGITS